MAQKLDYSIPFNDLIQYVPQNLRNPVISGLIDNLFNRFMTHDESVPMFGYVGRRPTTSDDRTLRIPQPSAERDLNAVTPVLSFDVGSQKFAFTTQDLIKKAAALGIDTTTRNWLYTQGSNYLPPIDIDKFANFYQYYWIAKAVDSVPSMAWNTELLPEYYVIAPPAPTDLDKLNVEVATTGPIVRTGTGFLDQSFVVTFTAADTFTLAATAALPAGYSITAASATGGATQTVTPSGYTCTLPPATLEQTYENVFYFNVTGPGGLKTLVEFTVSRDPIYNSSGVWTGSNETFVAGDVFTIDTVFLSSTYNIAYSILPGIKGKISGVKSLNEYQIVDGIQLTNGMRILVKNNSSTDNGIYLVGPQGFTRTPDYDGATIVAGARVWVRSGTTNGGKLFTSAAGNSWPAGVVSISNTNDWQEGNFWVHGDELSGLGLTKSDVIQATRPIIEYGSSLKLNSFISNDLPADSGIQFKQVKSEFNQLPMFDLYRYDGTHSGYVSSIFYYEEDPGAELDVALQKRVKLSTSSTADYIFNHGLQDEAGQMLFYKAGTVLKSIWHAGYVQPTVVDSEFVGAAKGTITKLVPTTISVPQTWTLTYTSTGTFSVVGSVTGALAADVLVNTEYVDSQFSIIVTSGDIPFVTGESFVFTISAGPTVSSPIFNGAVKGSMTAVTAADFTQQQVWTFEATSSTTFKVSSSKMGALPAPVDVLTVGVPYTNADISCIITAGTLAFDAGDVFHLRIANLEFPRYVYRDATGSIADLYGGPAADVDAIGAYEAPRTFIHNPYNSSRDEVSEGTLYSHFRSILQNQLDTTAPDYAFGGTIKNWSEQHTLLASLLMQRDSTPISLIDYAQARYDAGLNAISDIFKTIVVQYYVTAEPVVIDGSIDQQQRLTRLVDHILSIRAQDHDVRTVLYDSTSGVTGIPITLPQMGLAHRVVPQVTFDNILGRDVLIHHDGHKSVLVEDDVEFRKTLLSNDASYEVTLPSGSTAPAVGSFTQTAPASPFNGQLWIYPDGADSFMFVYEDGSWLPVNIADVLNSVILEVEARLYSTTNPNARQIDYSSLMSDAAFNAQLRSELFTFAAMNGLAPLASDYSPANPLTWNYSGALLSNFPPMATPTVPARWYNVLLSHQSTVPGVIPTERPNLEPWKLFGFSTLQAWWATLTPLQQAAYTPYATPDELRSIQFADAGYVRLVKTDASVFTLTGLPLIDGIQVNAGDRILIQNDLAPANNGIWIASSGVWTRDATSLVQDVFVTVTEGVAYSGTQWALSQTVVAINVDPVLFKQVRYWTSALWAAVQSARPTLRLSINTVTDALLPPYVSPSTVQASNALTTVIPAGVSNAYNFGEGSPVESVWTNTLEYRYSLVRALFRHDPLLLLGFAWGFNWIEVDGLLFDSFDINTPSHSNFRLHGEKVSAVARTSTALTLTTATGSAPIDVTVVYDAYEVSSGSRYQNFSVRSADGSVLGYVREGQSPVTVSSYGITLTNIAIEDAGVPFRMGDSFRITADADGSNLVITFTSNPVYHFRGLGQIFTNALRSSAIDTTDSFAIDAYRNWDVNMGYRAGGLVSTDQLTIRTDADTLSPSSYSLLLKKNEYARDIWLQALRITVEQFGTAVERNGALAPPESVDQYGSIVNRAVITDPSQMALNADDWVFRIEGYNPRYTNISYYVLNTGAEYQTFNVLDQTATTTVWKNFEQQLSVQTTSLPLIITGLQNVVNFVFGYSKYLTDQGWAFGVDQTVSVDATTGRVRGWQLEVEKLIDSIYRGVAYEQGHILNPFIDEVWVKHPTGLLAEFKDTSLFDVRADAAIYDVGGVKFNSNDVTIIRGNEQSRFGAAAPMYTAHAQINEYEHLIIFDNYIEDSTQSGTLYHPFSGARTVTYKFDGRRQARTTFRPEFGGHYLVGNEVRQNLQASTDNITKFFDANHVFENSLTSRHALALLGFNDKDYFNDLDISDYTQFNFWRGLVQMKGTNMSIDAYLNNGRFIDAKIDEYWAYKIAEYGDARQRTFPELKIKVADTVQQFTLFQFDAADVDQLPSFTQIDSFDESRWVSIDDLDQESYFKAEVIGSYSLTTASAAQVIQLPFVADSLVGSGFTQLNATTVIADGGPLSITGYGAATPRYNPVKLFNYVADELVEEIPVWHPAAGQHTPTALESVNIVSSKNPARYNYSTEVANNNSYDPLRPWGPNEVGRVWFDTTNLAYIPYYDSFIFSDRLERLSRWGTIADYATVDVYEWVESPVPPSEFNALAAEQAGDADLDSTTKAAGEVALLQTYVRDRGWSVRPIAWSNTAVPDAAAHPYFPSTFDSILYIRDNYVSLESGLFSDYGIEAGMRLGEWNNVSYDLRPLSEFIVTSNFTKHLLLGGVDLSTAVPVTAGTLLPAAPYEYPYPTCDVSVAVSSYTSTVGPLLFSTVTNIPVRRSDADGVPIDVWDTPIQLKVTEVDSGDYDIITLYTATSTTAPTTAEDPGTRLFESTSAEVIELPSIGLTIRVTVDVSGTYKADSIRNAIVAALGADVVMQDAVQLTEVVGWNGASLELTNNTNEAWYTTATEWRAWSVPTQAQLDADTKQPNASWKPYLGEFYEVPATAALVQDAIAYADEPLTLNDGTVIDRYETTWGAWSVLKNETLTAVQTLPIGNVVLTHTENISADTASVYVDGIAQLSSSYSIVGPELTVFNVTVGSTVVVIIRHYEPSTEDLEFNPDVADDLSYQQHYKEDYEYVSHAVRDSDGTPSSTLYYFWVKNKTTAARGKKMSIQAIAQALRDGPANYLTFQNLKTASGALPYRYDAISLSGMSYAVTKDDTFKLRFTRNFTLRDDPQQLDLKDTHTEWTLLRPGQRTRIPEVLWRKLTDSMAGEDIAGNAVPALRRVLYDERNGTTSRFGFSAEQALAPQDLLVSSVSYTIVNTKLTNTNVPPNADGVYPPDFLEFLDFNAQDEWFATPAATRQTMTDIWTQGKPTQINEIFFAALDDILANNLELTDIFKTSRLSAYSIKIAPTSTVLATYE